MAEAIIGVFIIIAGFGLLVQFAVSDLTRDEE